MQKHFLITVTSLLILISTGCSDRQNDTGSAVAVQSVNETDPTGVPRTDNSGRKYSEDREACAHYSPERRPLFGELHVHTSLSFDAAAGRTGTLPADAYRFAKGEAIPFFPVDDKGNVLGKISIDRPLDFVAVTDHGEFLGETALCKQQDSPAYDGEFCTEYRKVEFRGAAMIATSMSGDYPQRIQMLCGEDGQLCRDFAAEPWQVVMDAAEQAYESQRRVQVFQFRRI